jgi:hypothetical protein
VRNFLPYFAESFFRVYPQGPALLVRMFHGTLPSVIPLALMMGCASMRTAFDEGAVRRDPDGKPQMGFTVVRQVSSVDCGAACLAFVLNHWGADCTVKDIEGALSKPGPLGYTLAELQSYAQSGGFAAFIFSGNTEDLKTHVELGRPCIVVYRVNRKANHAVVVTEIKTADNGAVSMLVMDPRKKRRFVVKESWLEARWRPIGSPILLVGLEQKGDPHP